MNLVHEIDQLKDHEAAQLLTAALGPLDSDPKSDAVRLNQPAISRVQERAALEAYFGDPVNSSDGDLARAALHVLADDTERAANLRQLILHFKDQPGLFASRAVIETAVVVACAIVVLKTRVRFERKANGEWSLLIDKPTTSNSIVKPLVRGLLGQWPTEPFRRG